MKSILKCWVVLLMLSLTSLSFAQSEESCVFPITVNSLPALNDALTCYNALTTAGEYIIVLDSDITLDADLNPIDNATEAVSLTIDGAERIIDGADTYAIFSVEADTTVTFINLTLTNGRAPSGAALTNQGTVTIESSTISEHDADNRGGAILNQGTITIDNTDFFNNTSGRNGGAIASVVGASLTLQGGSQFQNNSALENGGAIWTNSTVYIRGTSFDTNAATLQGGAIYSVTTANVTINASNFRGNRVEGDGETRGGAIFTRANMTINASTFDNNRAVSGNGGAIFNGADADLIIDISIFLSNQASYQGVGFTGLGGAIFNNGDLRIRSDSVISGNRARNGGAVFNHTDGIAELTTSSIANNTASRNGGAFLNNGDLTLDENIIGSNFASIDSGAVHNGTRARFAQFGNIYTGNIPENVFP